MEFVKYEQRNRYGIITINREEALNALNSAVLDELNEILDNIDTNAVRCLIITGAGGKSFVAGADIKEMLELDKSGGEFFGKKGNDVFAKIENFALPVICAINGYALGGGCELALSCDFRICSEKAVFAQPEVGLGIIPGFGGTQRLMRAVGMGMAKQMIYSAGKIDAAEALRIGLVNAVYAPEELMPAAEKLADIISKNAPIAVQKSKIAINSGSQLPINKGTEIETRLFGECFETDDRRAAMGAFIERRKNVEFFNR
ncbi:MAG: enoyl-CoA hydratase-related protein [Candidatus Riflebacteria bacterium]|nr:enoyl-CoA hydratase-related protein [Candidatus Riflebacteria bacterium]